MINDLWMFGLPDSDSWSLNFLFPNSWLKQRTTALLLYERHHFFLLAEMMKKMRKTTRSFIFPALQTCARIFALGLCRWMTDERKSPPEVPAAAAAARGREEAFCMQQRHLQAGVSGESGDGGQDRHHYSCCLGMQKRKTHYKCIQCIC